MSNELKVRDSTLPMTFTGDLDSIAINASNTARILNQNIKLRIKDSSLVIQVAPGSTQQDVKTNLQRSARHKKARNEHQFIDDSESVD